MQNILKDQEEGPRLKRYRYVSVGVKLSILLLLYLIKFDVVWADWVPKKGEPASWFKASIFFFTGSVLVDGFRILMLQAYYLRRRRLSLKAQPNFVVGIGYIASLTNYVLMVFGIFMFFDMDPVEVFTSLSIVAAALAILSKDYISNMINGMILMFTDHISIGDYVRIQEHRGKIVDINLMNIHLLSDDEDMLYIPNNTVLTTDVTNFTKRPIKRINFDFEMGYAYIKDINKLEDYLVDALAEFADNIQEDSYNLKTVQVLKDYAMMKFQYVLKVYDEQQVWAIRRTIARKVIEFVNTMETT